MTKRNEQRLSFKLKDVELTVHLCGHNSTPLSRSHERLRNLIKLMRTLVTRDTKTDRQRSDISTLGGQRGVAGGEIGR